MYRPRDLIENSGDIIVLNLVQPYVKYPKITAANLNLVYITGGQHPLPNFRVVNLVRTAVPRYLNFRYSCTMPVQLYVRGVRQSDDRRDSVDSQSRAVYPRRRYQPAGGTRVHVPAYRMMVARMGYMLC
eukprot:SAG31_NODE_2386_length_5814_cov_3.981627_1_plen_129_part_00